MSEPSGNPSRAAAGAGGEAGDTHAEIVIVGGGAAGLQAALVLGRSRRRVVVVDGGHPRNEHAGAVHNLAGNEGIPPADLLGRARSDAARYGVVFLEGTVLAARPAAAGDGDGDGDGNPDRSSWQLTVTERESGGGAGVGGGGGGGREGDAGDGGGSAVVLTAESLVLATGVTEDLPDLPGLAELWGHDVVSCPYCHGWEATGLPVAVVGSGERAWRQLLLLSRFTDDLTLIASGSAGLEASRLSRLERLGVTVREDPVARVVAKDGRLVGVEFADGRLVPYGALFAATARRQASSLPAMLGCRISGAAVTTDAEGRTGVPGVWAVGTCADPSLTVAGAMGRATTTAIALNTALVDAETA